MKYTFKHILHNLFKVPWDNLWNVKKRYAILPIEFSEQAFTAFKENLKDSKGRFILIMLNDKKQVRNRIHFKFIGYEEI